MPAQRSGQSARTRAPREPRIYLRSIEKLKRMRERHGDPQSRTLCFTFDGAGKSRRARNTFVATENVPEFDGEEAWFEMEAVERGNGHMWSWWRAVRQVEPPAHA